MLAVTVWNVCGERGERVDGSVNERLEDGTCGWEKPVDGTSTVRSLLTGRAGAAVTWGSSPRIWLSFLAFLKSLCFFLTSRLFLEVSVDGVDEDDK